MTCGTLVLHKFHLNNNKSNICSAVYLSYTCKRSLPSHLCFPKSELSCEGDLLFQGSLMHTLNAGMFRDTCIFSIPVQVFPVSCGSLTVSPVFTLTLFVTLHLNERMSSTPAAQQRSNMSQARSVLHTPAFKVLSKHRGVTAG